MTANEKAEIDTIGGRIRQTVEPLTNYFVGRVQKDFKEGKTIIGGMFTSTNRDLDAKLGSFMHKSAYSGGVDFTQYFKDKNWMFNINAAFSHVNGSKEAISSHKGHQPDITRGLTITIPITIPKEHPLPDQAEGSSFRN